MYLFQGIIIKIFHYIRNLISKTNKIGLGSPGSLYDFGRRPHWLRSCFYNLSTMSSLWPAPPHRHCPPRLSLSPAVGARSQTVL